MAVSTATATVARRVDADRKSAGVAVLSLAKATGIPRTTLTRMLSGKSDFRTSYLFVLGRELKINPVTWMADLPA